MRGPTPDLSGFYRPAEVATMLRCSEWWVKEQARKRRIPYSWIGGSYLFTAEHIAEIVRRFEVQPTDTGPAAPPPAWARVPAPRRPTEPTTDVEPDRPAVRLTARTPRRARLSTPDTTAA
jgi:hypothetical protein